MKENKKFFANNRLNKGYKKINNDQKSDEVILKEKYLSILPPLDIMEEYEEKFPGAFSKLFQMAEKEQENKLNIASSANDATLKKIKLLHSVFNSMFIALIAVLSIALYSLTDGNLLISSAFFVLLIAVFGLLNYKFTGLNTERPKKNFSNHPKRRNNNYKGRNNRK